MGGNPVYKFAVARLHAIGERLVELRKEEIALEMEKGQLEIFKNQHENIAAKIGKRKPQNRQYNTEENIKKLKHMLNNTDLHKDVIADRLNMSSSSFYRWMTELRDTGILTTER